MSLEVAVRAVEDLASLLSLLRDELDWPLPEHPDFDELTFEWSPEDLRLSEKAVAHNVIVRQLRPFTERQPWGIFFIEFEKNIYRTALRQVLRGLVPNRRQTPHLPSWDHENLLFICTTRDYDRFTFAHFRGRGEKTQRAVLTTFGWERGETALRTLCEYNLEALRFPDDPGDVEAWLNQWRKAFDVQAVTDAFFRDYKRVFAELQRHLYQQTNDKVWAHDYALQLLNRLMFLYFIQRKSTQDGRYWLGDNRRFIKSFWEAYRASGEKDSFFKRWLSVLFFEAFNNKFSPKPYLPKELNAALQLAPYLNGGLFTRNELDEKYSVELPDSVFELLFDRFDGTTPGFFERYNFTISENTPLDQEVAVDPEMIGKVYESLVNITFEGLEEEDRRGSAGIFYTPRVEIDLMCRLSLVDWLANQLGEEYKPLLYELVFAYDPHEKRQADEALAQEDLWPELNRLLREVTVLDPACGSGSFLVGMLLVLDDLQARANAQLGIEETPYERRRRIIGQSLYGVDVMAWAVHVAELRLWLQLVIETELKTAELKFRPLLPNLSFKVRPGDSLVQELGGLSFALHCRHLDIPSALKGKLTRLKGEKLKFYRADPDDPPLYRSESELKQAEYQLFREILETKAHALQNEIITLNRRIEHPSKIQALEGIDVEDKQLELRVQEWKQQRDELQEQSDRLREALAALKSAQDVPFIWDLAFVEIFEGDKGGFDIVIGNPPYVRQEKIAPPLLSEENYDAEKWRELKREYKTKLQQSVREIYPRFFTNRTPDGKSDLYIYFYLHGLSLLNERGSFCFITSNSWLDVGYGRELQEFLLKHGHVKLILDNEKKRSFAQADVNTIIALLGPPDDKRSDGLTKTARFVMFKAAFEEVLSASIFKQIEAAPLRRSESHFRVIAKGQRELYEESLVAEEPEDEGEETEERPKRRRKPAGPLVKAAKRYEANKWGGKYLRAPDIFFTILEKGKGKLVRLGDIAEVRRGFTTGANEFFYLEPVELTVKEVAELREKEPKAPVRVRNGAGWEGEIEDAWLRPVIKSPREIRTLKVRLEDLRYLVFMPPEHVRQAIERGDPQPLRGYPLAEAYIRWGEGQGYQHRPTCASRRWWWDVGEQVPPDAFWFKAFNDRLCVPFSDAKLPCSDRLYAIRCVVGSENKAVAVINSTLEILSIEMHGRVSLGEGALDNMTFEATDNVCLHPSAIPDHHAKDLLSIFDRLSEHPIRSIFEELGFPLCRERGCKNDEHPYEHVKPEALNLEQVRVASLDRFALDDVVFDVLGLTQEERLQVYQAVAQLVKDRLEKARSV